MRVQSYVWTGISVHVHVFSKNVEWFTMDYTSHTIPERNIEVNKFPRLLFCYVFGVCVCVCVSGSCGGDGWSLFREGLHLTWKNALISPSSAAQRQRQLGFLCVSHSNGKTSLWNQWCPARQKHVGDSMRDTDNINIEYLTHVIIQCIYILYVYVQLGLNTGNLSCFCVLVPAQNWKS